MCANVEKLQKNVGSGTQTIALIKQTEKKVWVLLVQYF